ncbi:unnamed protein product [Cyprideis torosa]|uniref:Uncharacterized protein n=1 Tax=Cyprideis torosa TaxID=163714 RepID=A0A7R9A066_9CRUS|nr:unnamed protein product [Cyprideis torosa]CAG0910686.1 unnamed protein product [Cyprideis torosa]
MNRLVAGATLRPMVRIRRSPHKASLVRWLTADTVALPVAKRSGRKRFCSNIKGHILVKNPTPVRNVDGAFGSKAT